jgi:LysR family cys regulon transcriptional activator
MNLRQLRYLCAVIDNGLSVTRAATALHTSQPGVSRQLLSLEREIGTSVLARRANRIIGLTGAGREVAAVARRMLNDAGNLRHIGQDFGNDTHGKLVIGTSHAHARYVLPGIIRKFRSRFPDVQILIRQCNEDVFARLVASGEADIGVGAESLDQMDDLLTLPCYALPRSVITPPRHPLTRLRKLTLEQIARYPILTLDPLFAGGRKVLQAFATNGLKPVVVVQATDADVIKAYVELGLGVAILPTVTFLPDRDRHLCAIDARNLFEPTVMCVEIRKDTYLRSYIFDFIQMLAPQWTRENVKDALRPGGTLPRKAVSTLRPMLRATSR